MIKGFFVLISIGFILSAFVTYFEGENLVKYGKTEEGTEYFYDKDSIERRSEIVKVWTKSIFNKKDKRWSGFVEDCKKVVEPNSNNDCNRLSNKKDLYEINCKEDTCRFLSSVMYDEDGKVLYSMSSPSKCDYIVPDSTTEQLKNRVCK
jgi:hypothetical protein